MLDKGNLYVRHDVIATTKNLQEKRISKMSINFKVEKVQPSICPFMWARDVREPIQNGLTNNNKQKN